MILQSDLFHEVKEDFTQAAAFSVLLYGCTPTKRMAKKLEGS